MGDGDEWQPPADWLAFLDMMGLEPLGRGYEPVYQRWLFPISLTHSIGVNICINLALGVPFIPRPRLNREGTVASLKTLTHNDSLRAENGIDKAVCLIEEIFN